MFQLHLVLFQEEWNFVTTLRVSTYTNFPHWTIFEIAVSSKGEVKILQLSYIQFKKFISLLGVNTQF